MEAGLEAAWVAAGFSERGLVTYLTAQEEEEAATFVEAALLRVLAAAPAMHWEYQSFCFWQVYPETQVESPEKPWPPHWP